MKEYKYKRPKEKTLIIGRNPVLIALESDEDMDKVLINSESSGEPLPKIISLARAKNIPLVKVPKAKLDAITDKNHQGVLAFRSPIDFQRVEDVIPLLFEQGLVPRVVVLDGISDVRNAGAIARSAHCFNMNAILVGSKGSAALNEDAVKTSAGALLRMPICRETMLRDAVTSLKNSGLKIYATTLNPNAKSLYETKFEGPLAILLGAEDLGVSNELLQLADEEIFIPMPAEFDSLNVSVAAGIVFYEINRP